MGITVGIVEDDPELRAAFSTLVAGGEGMTVVGSYPSGEDALTALPAHPPDAVLMDINLPGMTGIEALAQLRADATTASIPVAALTAYAMKDDRARILASGFDGYLEKPVDVRALPAQVAALLSR